MISDSILNSLQNDLEKAISYSNNGEKNKSRVLARLIAGKAIREVLRDINFPNSTRLTPYQSLEAALKKPEVFEPVFSDLEALTTKVNYDYSFPKELNLINSTIKILTFVKHYKGTYE